MKKQLFLLFSLNLVAFQTFATESSGKLVDSQNGKVRIILPTPSEQNLAVDAAQLSRAANIIYGLTTIYQATQTTPMYNDSVRENVKNKRYPAYYEINNNFATYSLSGISTLLWGAAHTGQIVDNHQTGTSFMRHAWSYSRIALGIVIPIVLADTFLFSPEKTKAIQSIIIATEGLRYANEACQTGNPFPCSWVPNEEKKDGESPIKVQTLSNTQPKSFIPIPTNNHKQPPFDMNI